MENRNADRLEALRPDWRVIDIFLGWFAVGH